MMSWWKIEMHDSVNDIELFRFDGATWPDDHVRAFKALNGVGPFTVTRVVPDRLPPIEGGHMALIKWEREQSNNCMATRGRHKGSGHYCGCVGGWKNGKPCPNNNIHETRAVA